MEEKSGSEASEFTAKREELVVLPSVKRDSRGSIEVREESWE